MQLRHVVLSVVAVYAASIGLALEEIQVDRMKSHSGLGTVELSDSGMHIFSLEVTKDCGGPGAPRAECQAFTLGFGLA